MFSNRTPYIRPVFAILAIMRDAYVNDVVAFPKMRVYAITILLIGFHPSVPTK